MKTVRIIILFFLIYSYQVNAQSDITNNPFANIEIGSNKYFVILMKKGKSHHARIISVDKKQALLMNPGGNTFIVPTSDIIRITEKAHESKGSIGLGFGIPYGLLGFNFDIRLYKNLYFTGGLGTGIFVTPMYNFGSKFILRSGNYKWRPRLSAYYGTYGLAYIEGYNSTIRETFSGFTVGLGQQWTLGITKTWGIDFDILYIVDDSVFEKRIQELKSQGYELEMASNRNIKISLGVRYCF